MYLNISLLKSNYFIEKFKIGEATRSLLFTRIQVSMHSTVGAGDLLLHQDPQVLTLSFARHC